MLEVELLEAGAKAPVVAHAGEDLGYDIFALEDTVLKYGEVTLVRTGIAVAAYGLSYRQQRLLDEKHYLPSEIKAETPLGLIIKDRSSIASKGIVTSGGVIDAGYRGEIKVLMTNWNLDAEYQRENDYAQQEETGMYLSSAKGYHIQAGDKIAQMVPVEVLTGEVFVKGKLSEASRGMKGFGSSGR